jgi:hypothetical protein
MEPALDSYYPGAGPISRLAWPLLDRLLGAEEQSLAPFLVVIYLAPVRPVRGVLSTAHQSLLVGQDRPLEEYPSGWKTARTQPSFLFLK